MPYQCAEKLGNLLAAARDSSIDLFNLEDGSYLSTWTCPSSEKPQNEKLGVEELNKVVTTQESQSSSVDIVVDSSSPPAKRRKLSSGGAEKQETPTNEPEEDTRSKYITKMSSNGKDGKQSKKQKQNNRSVAISTGLGAPAIIALAVTQDEKNVIAVTGEDKCIRVFKVVDEGRPSYLKQVSERQVLIPPL
jgi:tRNA (guanine-N(7)-)-methyltransferase subunit TRM82